MVRRRLLVVDRRRTLSSTGKWVAWLVHGFLGFMAFNAVVVFPVGPIRWFGLVACVVLAALWAGTRFARRG